MDHDADDMLATIALHLLDTAAETGVHALSPDVERALLAVPRDRFLPPSYRDEAWRDSALPIGYGQTISQPFIVALMTQLLAPSAGQRVLEVGSGCGYQLAVLAQIVDAAFGIERVPELAEQSAGTLHALGYGNARVRTGDGYEGWPEEQPFDGILVTAAGGDVPEPLKRQLRVGGRLVLPVEDAHGWQHLVVVERHGKERFSERKVLGVRFVPLLRARGG